MKLALSLFVVCVSVMMCTAVPVPEVGDVPRSASSAPASAPSSAPASAPSSAPSSDLAEPISSSSSSATGMGVGKEATAGSSTVEDQLGRASSGYGASKDGIALAQSNSFTGFEIPEEWKKAIRARIEARYGPQAVKAN